MRTVLTSDPARAARELVRGGTAAFPTETVYGLGANAFDADAVAKVFRAKGRPSDNPLIVHLYSLHQLRDVARRIPPTAQALIDAFFPGPLTVILPRHAAVPDAVTAGLDTVGVRMPAHPVARRFLTACGFPVAAPSANRSGRPSPTSWQAVAADLSGRIPCILKGARSRVGVESTVVDCSGRVPVVLRPGAVTLEQLRRIVPSTRAASAADSRRARSPGMRHRHYAPHARVVLGEPTAADPHSAFIGLRRPAVRGLAKVRVCASVEEYARELFHVFRLCEEAGVETIYAQPVPERGLGVALMDRLKRAARG